MRKMVIAAALAAASVLTLAACNNDAGTEASDAAATGIDGTWKVDLASVQLNDKPDEVLLQDGKFSCSTCLPPYEVAADGAFHPVTRPYADSMMVKVDDDHNITTTSKKGDAVTGETRYSVSEDGKTLTINFTDSSVPGATPVTGNLTQTRVADAPAGAHLVSGSWKAEKYNDISEDGLTLTFRLEGDTLHLSTPSGISYAAQIGGPPVPITGDTAGTMAQVTKPDDNTYVETDTRDGEVISVITMTLGEGGKMHVVSEDKRDGSSVTYDANRS